MFLMEPQLDYIVKNFGFSQGLLVVFKVIKQINPKDLLRVLNTFQKPLMGLNSFLTVFITVHITVSIKMYQLKNTTFMFFSVLIFSL